MHEDTSPNVIQRNRSYDSHRIRHLFDMVKSVPFLELTLQPQEENSCYAFAIDVTPAFHRCIWIFQQKQGNRSRRRNRVIFPNKGWLVAVILWRVTDISIKNYLLKISVYNTLSYLLHSIILFKQNKKTWIDVVTTASHVFLVSGSAKINWLYKSFSLGVVSFLFFLKSITALDFL